MNKRFKFSGEYLNAEKIFDLKIYFFLLLIILVGYYNVSLMIHPLKWDLIDYAYPYRYYIGECVRNGFFPYWLPYQQLGIPVCADPQSGTWYPVTWIFGFFSGYTIYTISVEYLLHIFLASAGFYLLSKNTGLSKWIAFILAICYAFSGFIVGNSQHLNYIIAAAWIPFVLNSYLMLIKRKKIVYAAATALFAYLLTTGGHPAFWIILFYHLLAIIVIYSGWLVYRKRTKEFLPFLKLNMAAILIYGLLALSFFVSILYNKDQIGRFGNVSLIEALSGPFSPQSTLSFISPYAITENAEFLKTDISMANAYFGLFSLAFFILYFFQKKSKISILILIAGVLNLLISFGEYLPFRELLYRYVPFMDFFRFPSVFRHFVIVAFLLTAGFSMQRFFDGKDKKLPYIIILLILAMITSILIFRTYGHLNLKNMAFDLAWKSPNGSTILQRIAFQLIIQAGLLLFFLLAYRFSKIKIHYLVLAFVLLDVLTAARLNSSSTVYSGSFKSKEIRTFEKQHFVHGFPVTDIPIAACSDSTGYYQHFWRNLSMYYQRPAYDGYSPFQIKSCMRLVDHQTVFFKKIKQNRLFYFADTIINNFDSITAALYGRQGMVFTEGGLPVIRSFNIKDQKIKITGFSPNEVRLTAECSDSSLLVFFQNFNKGWQATINNSGTKIHRVNLTLNSIVVPPGKNEITFSYKPLPVIIAQYVSLGTLILVLFFIVLLASKQNLFTKNRNTPE